MIKNWSVSPATSHWHIHDWHSLSLTCHNRTSGCNLVYKEVYAHTLGYIQADHHRKSWWCPTAHPTFIRVTFVLNPDHLKKKKERCTPLQTTWFLSFAFSALGALMNSMNGLFSLPWFSSFFLKHYQEFRWGCNQTFQATCMKFWVQSTQRGGGRHPPSHAPNTPRTYTC